MQPSSVVIREQSREMHTRAELTPLMIAVASGQVDVETYGKLLGQMQLVYAALDEGAAMHRSDSRFALFFDARLDRTAAIQADLSYFGLEQAEPTEATASYAERIREVSREWPHGLLAHHYTRYLGDLSGGRVISKALSTSLGLAAEAGLAFYDFPIAPGPAFKNAYREALDALEMSEGEQVAFAREVNDAFAFNIGMFASIPFEWAGAEPASKRRS